MQPQAFGQARSPTAKLRGGFDVGQHRAVREFTPRVLLEGVHRLQGLNRRTEPLIEGVHGVMIGVSQVLRDARRGVGLDSRQRDQQSGP